MSITKIRDNLWIGGCVGIDNREIARAGINDIVHLAKEQPDPYDLASVEIIPLSDDEHNDPAAINRAVEHVKSQLRHGACVLLACAEGRSRAPHIAALVLSDLEGRSYADVYAEIRRLRPEVLEKSCLVGGKV